MEILKSKWFNRMLMIIVACALAASICGIVWSIHKAGTEPVSAEVSASPTTVTSVFSSVFSSQVSEPSSEPPEERSEEPVSEITDTETSAAETSTSQAALQDFIDTDADSETSSDCSLEDMPKVVWDEEPEVDFLWIDSFTPNPLSPTELTEIQKSDIQFYYFDFMMQVLKNHGVVLINKDGTADIIDYLGTYHGYIAVTMAKDNSYSYSTVTHDSVAGYDFMHNSYNEIIVIYKEDFYASSGASTQRCFSLSDAYDSGYLTDSDIQNIAYYSYLNHQDILKYFESASSD